MQRDFNAIHIDEYDFTLCTECHSTVQPYSNVSITTITSVITTIDTTSFDIIAHLKDMHHSTATLLSYQHLNCQKCGLFIDIHPRTDEHSSSSCSKIFICSNHAVPCKYCLCYQCGLLYGINPNQTGIADDIINKLQSKLSTICPQETEKDEELSLEYEDDDHSLERDDDEKTKNVSQIDESYTNLIALQTKLNILSTHSKTMSCPSSPLLKNIPLLKKKSRSLRTSPMLNASTPSPRDLGRTVDESEKKWMQYLSRQSRNDTDTKQSTLSKLEGQQKKLEELQKLQKELSAQKRNSEQFAKLFKSGTYSRFNSIEI